jgi:hypothetical protein
MKTKEIKEWLGDSNVSKAWGSDTKSPPIDLGTAIELGCHVKIVHKLYYLDLPGLFRYLQVAILHGGKLWSTSKNQTNMVFNDVMKTSTLNAATTHLCPSWPKPSWAPWPCDCADADDQSSLVPCNLACQPWWSSFLGKRIGWGWIRHW